MLCACGFSCGTQTALEKHVRRFADQADEHYALPPKEVRRIEAEARAKAEFEEKEQALMLAEERERKEQALRANFEVERRMVEQFLTVKADAYSSGSRPRTGTGSRPGTRGSGRTGSRALVRRPSTGQGSRAERHYCETEDLRLKPLVVNGLGSKAVGSLSLVSAGSGSVKMHHASLALRGRAQTDPSSWDFTPKMSASEFLRRCASSGSMVGADTTGSPTAVRLRSKSDMPLSRIGGR
eukprot:TRINITY_DN12459_c0_g1_i1.p1 TRINITY_DN12459_c0_g1~~TRINITY_DN12459_c0_g1_i1.p1  ORF type:complete len:239 (+),score=43.99 TRINITY_DN12459_c0_g1_i1:78-794(+)